MQFRKNYDASPLDACVGDPAEGRTQQHFVNEVDINQIMERFTRTGELPLSGTGVYGDASNIGSYQDVMNQIRAAEEAFDEVPDTIKKYFDYDPGRMLAFVEDPQNREEAIRIGLITKKEAKEPQKIGTEVPKKEPEKAPSAQSPT